MTPIALAMAALPVLVAAAIAAAFSRASARAGAVSAGVLASLLAAQWLVAESGLLHRWHATPPPLMPIVGGMAALAGAVALSAWGNRLNAAVPLAALIGFQGFRLPLELVMHRAAVDGAMPIQMSYSGWNFDVVSGASALAVAGLVAAGRAPGWLIVGWNALGSLLLLTIVGIAIASTPTFAAFGSDRLNTWIADPPFVWLPGLLVPAALFGHLLLWRRLVRARRAATLPGGG